MNSCPHCKQPIRARTILLSPCPVWITCPECRTKLVGNWLIKIQGVIVTVVSAFLGIAVVRAESPLSQKITFVIVAALMIGLLNVFITLRWGRYQLRASSASAYPVP
jgi:hypothetical protein